MCSILRKRRTTQVLWTGKPLPATHCFARLIAMPLQDNKSPFLFSVCCFSLSAPPPPHSSLLPRRWFRYISDYCRMQGRGIRSESQDSRSPDSACSLDYDSSESSPDHILDGKVLLWMHAALKKKESFVQKLWTPKNRVKHSVQSCTFSASSTWQETVCFRCIHAYALVRTYIHYLHTFIKILQFFNTKTNTRSLNTLKICYNPQYVYLHAVRDSTELK